MIDLYLLSKTLISLCWIAIILSTVLAFNKHDYIHHIGIVVLALSILLLIGILIVDVMCLAAG